MTDNELSAKDAAAIRDIGPDNAGKMSEHALRELSHMKWSHRALSRCIEDIAMLPVRQIHENRLPENQALRRRVQKLRIAEFTLTEAGFPDRAKLVREVIDDLVQEHRAINPVEYWRG